MKNLIAKLREHPTTIPINGIVTFLIGDYSVKLVYLVLLIILDTFWRVKFERKRNNFSFKKMFRGLIPKIVEYLFYLMVANSIDNIVGVGDGIFRKVCIFAIASTELTSVWLTSKESDDQVLTKIIEKGIRGISKVAPILLYFLPDEIKKGGGEKDGERNT